MDNNYLDYDKYFHTFLTIFHEFAFVEAIYLVKINFINLLLIIYYSASSTKEFVVEHCFL